MTTFTRRLQKIGSSMLVSLPKEWIDANNLNKSNQVEIETNQNNLSIRTQQNKKPSKEVEISYPLSEGEGIVPTITGAYLLGFDIIRIVGRSSISINDRESVRGSMRKLVGLEIIDEDATNISIQFLLNETSINPQNILKRMSSIALGMFNDVVLSIKNGDKTNLETIANRDAEINRQYFLLVRLIRSTIMDTRLANIFNLENIDILDYRIAANTVEIAGDTVVELSKSLIKSNLSKAELTKLYDLAKDIDGIQIKSVDSFISNNRMLAINAIKLQKINSAKISKIRSSLESEKQISLALFDIIYMFEKILQSWSDITDLVKPSYQ
ncbi:MAG: phosphate uptake regulator PhoU [Candidatus Nitrosopumilus limneticus]|nr:phosphate uptake regulator PhoU [Candidatus Nitrosopumilus limneticus]MDC4214504.1 phosphate uptake regulator PhoU [Candidatus Nitrosopumilus limneticus]MDC4216124.1 phosphate uptake regulator PhoU [Candidatus Nitrosopumilus limneticus]MDC4219726.1 phosphate uptake regulator PhoU [Candidatus Nitrosopumilus limneticus]MDC4221332.1 phosphate uptake regulator PhoU [Candidatus Nitrosopumilus limneticus]